MAALSVASVSAGREESPGSLEARCRITSGGGDPRDSATESKPPSGFDPGVRVKGCGKSAPRSWQQERHGKPHREQDRIGAARRVKPPVSFPDEPPGLVARGAWRQAPEMNGHRRAPMQSAVQNPAYRLGDMLMAGAWRGPPRASLQSFPAHDIRNVPARGRGLATRRFLSRPTLLPGGLDALRHFLAARSPTRRRAGSPRRKTVQPRSGNEAISVHHLVPGRHEVTRERLLRIVLGIDFGKGAQLRV